MTVSGGVSDSLTSLFLGSRSLGGLFPHESVSSHRGDQDIVLIVRSVLK